jgi:hypothetical protein
VLTIKLPWLTVPTVNMKSGDWFALGLVLSIAIVLRVLFYTGVLGSDEVTYVETAVKIASGDWQASDYIGATRYGMNLPLALSISVFGLSETSANLWSFLCSVGEVAIVFAVARWLWGAKVAIVSASLLAFLPLHVHYAGRMMADAPLAFFLTLSAALLLRAANSGCAWTYFAAGLAWGGVFWVKESVGILFLPIYFLLTIVLTGLSSRWIWILSGMSTAIAANCVLMSYVAGDPMYLLNLMKLATANANGLPIITSPWYYFHYLFIDVKHTLLLGYLALTAVALYARKYAVGKCTESGTGFVILWGVLLIGMFSFAVVSFDPVKLVMKQVNYMLIFTGPLTLLSGWFLSSLPRLVFLPLTGLIVCGSVVLAALEQQVIEIFTANSRAAYSFLRDHPNSYLVGTRNNNNVINFISMMEDRRELRSHFKIYSSIADTSSANFLTWHPSDLIGQEVFILAFDEDKKLVQGKSSGVLLLSDVPQCWLPMGTLNSAPLSSSGRWVVSGLLKLGDVLPESLRFRYFSILKPVSTPEPAYLFKVNHTC